MARTLRRGKPSANLHHYLNLDVVWGERDCYSLNRPLWKDGEDDPRTYAQYVTQSVRRHHRDRRSDTGLPRYVRKLDVDRQSREHKQLILKAVRTQDFDVALTRMAQQASWAYW